MRERSDNRSWAWYPDGDEIVRFNLEIVVHLDSSASEQVNTGYAELLTGIVSPKLSEILEQKLLGLLLDSIAGGRKGDPEVMSMVRLSYHVKRENYRGERQESHFG